MGTGTDAHSDGNNSAHDDGNDSRRGTASATIDAAHESTTQTHRSQQRGDMRRSMLRGLLWGTLVAVIAGITGLALLRLGATRAKLPELGEVPDFTLIDSSGGAFGLADLEGNVWIADFIFTRCAGTCPAMTAQMIEVRRRLANRPVRYVSISVDPEYDTPAEMAAYAERFGVGAEDAHDWSFLTGEKPVIYELIKGGFHLGVQDVEAEGGSVEDAVEPFIHSTRFVLVDHDAHIRGYYDGLDRAAMQQLLRDCDRLAENVPEG